MNKICFFTTEFFKVLYLNIVGERQNVKVIHEPRKTSESAVRLFQRKPLKGRVDTHKPIDRGHTADVIELLSLDVCMIVRFLGVFSHHGAQSWTLS